MYAEKKPAVNTHDTQVGDLGEPTGIKIGLHLAPAPVGLGICNDLVKRSNNTCIM